MTKKRAHIVNAPAPEHRAGFSLRDLLRRANRGLLLDIFVFVVNIFLMRMLVGRFTAIATDAYADDRAAQFVIFVYFLAMLFLAPAGAILKRWHFHQRLWQEDVDESAVVPSGCLFNPLIYYAEMVLIFAVVNAFVFRFFYGDQREDGALMVVSIVVGLAAMAVHTWLVYRYFSPPDRPRSRFLLSPLSEMIGDICIFVNMLLFQIMWALLWSGFSRPMSGYDIFTNLLAVTVGALLIYFPPRLIYLAEDIHRRKTWIFIALANLPAIYYAVFGNGHGLRLH